jgi:hypothetical protein
MAIYVLRLYGANGKIAAVRRLSAETDEKALTIVHGTFEETSAIARFDLWQGERRVEGVAPTMRGGKPRPKKKPRARQG